MLFLAIVYSFTVLKYESVRNKALFWLMLVYLIYGRKWFIVIQKLTTMATMIMTMLLMMMMTMVARGEKDVGDGDGDGGSVSGGGDGGNIVVNLLIW